MRKCPSLLVSRPEIACHFKSYQDGKYKEKGEEKGPIKSDPLYQTIGTGNG